MKWKELFILYQLMHISLNKVIQNRWNSRHVIESKPIYNISSKKLFILVNLCLVATFLMPISNGAKTNR